ncbi:MAG TPA: thermosome subunit [Candidatus Poseidoniales archaeon]|nr:MAG TPA: thermosome subunit [Candidatus Poseidoniales archaeon]HII27948.1 thermosome subunit [Poseidonia sp.]
MSEVPILKETTRTTGREALRNNITAAMALAGAVRTTLGPLGQDKLLIDDEGRTMVTNDGVTVLESAKVEHPVARMLINASTTQDRIARDGTTSAVLLSAELLQNAWELVLQGIHPSAIARGYRHAEEACRNHFDSLVIEATDAQMHAAATTSLSGKIHNAMQTHLADLAIQAAGSVVEQGLDGPQADPTRVKTLTQTGGSMTDSSLVTGLVLAKKRVSDRMPKHLGSGKVALIDGGLERRDMMSSVKLNVSGPGVLESFRQQEKSMLLEQIDHLVELGVTLLACKEGIDDDVHAALTDAGIQAYRRVARSDLDLLARCTNGTLNNDIKGLTPSDLGVFISSNNERWNGVMHWIVHTEEGGATFIAKGSTNEAVGEVERCFADALGVACQLLEEPLLLAGGGATQIALARHLRRFAERFAGREQLAIEAFADALEIIPRTLAQNAGLDPLDSLLQTVAKQSTDGSDLAHRIGLNVERKAPSDMVVDGVVEPLRITRQVLAGATEAALSVLRIDDVLWAKQDPTVPELPEED